MDTECPCAAAQIKLEAYALFVILNYIHNLK